MADLFSTDVLTMVVQSLVQPQSFLLDKFFPTEQREESLEIHFDVESVVRRMTPFVAPYVEGKVVENEGFTTNTFIPASTKDKRIFKPSQALKRSIGERIGGSLTPEARMQANLARALTDQIAMLKRRREWMAAQVLQNGQITVTGEKYPAKVVNFNRDSSLRVTLSGGARWSQAGVNPLDDLQTWANSILQLTGSQPVDVIMGLDVWKVFRANSYVQTNLATQRKLGDLPTLNQGSPEMEGATFKGTIDGFNIWVYTSWYVDDSGTTQTMLSAGTVLLVGKVDGVQAYGAIEDEEAGMQALPFFTKSWVDKDPGARYLLMQSKPLVVPYRVNATACATVL